MSTALLLLPDFALILLGAAIRRWMRLGEHFWSGLEKLVYFILFPALLINAIMHTHLDLAAAAPLLLSALAAMLAAMGMALLVRPLFDITSIQFASAFQCAFRFNSYLGLGAAGVLWGAPGIAALSIILGVAVPLANLSAVWMLARQGSLGLLREVVRNPLIWATTTGLLLNLASISLPQVVQVFLGRLGAASIALGLLAVGAALRMEKQRAHQGMFAATIVGIKLVAMPVAAIFIAHGLGLSGLYFKVVVLFAALPTASSAYILAMRMGGDGKSVAWQISASTLLSMLSLPLWVTWLAAH